MTFENYSFCNSSVFTRIKRKSLQMSVLLSKASPPLDDLVPEHFSFFPFYPVFSLYVYFRCTLLLSPCSATTSSWRGLHYSTLFTGATIDFFLSFLPHLLVNQSSCCAIIIWVCVPLLSDPQGTLFIVMASIYRMPTVHWELH